MRIRWLVIVNRFIDGFAWGLGFSFGIIIIAYMLRVMGVLG